jgi:hypothetical protein
MPTLPKFAVLCLLAGALAGCVTREPTPQEIRSKNFEAVAGRAVVYLYRDRPDFVDAAVGIMLDDEYRGTSYRGTFHRFELAPGRHRLSGYAGDIGTLEFAAEAGRIYFIRHAVTRLRGIERSVFQPVSTETGRPAVLQYELNSAP